MPNRHATTSASHGTGRWPRWAAASALKRREIWSGSAVMTSASTGVRLNWTWVALSSAAVAGYFVSQYLTASLATLAQDNVGLATTYAHRPAPVQAAFYVHIVAAGLALLLGPFQFARRIRRRHIRLHRATGRTYLTSVAIGAAAALVIAPFGSAAMVGFFGFGSLAVLWAWTAWRAWQAIRGRDLPNHQAWMIRNFALTYAAVTLRLWTVALIAVQLPFRSGLASFPEAYDTAYAAVPFLCWLPNIVIAEWLVRRRGLPTLRITPPTRPGRPDPGHQPDQGLVPSPHGG